MKKCYNVLQSFYKCAVQLKHGNALDVLRLYFYTMKKFLLLLIILLQTTLLHAQTPNPALIGYWQNWFSASAPYIPLNQVDTRYNIIDVAFAIPQAGTDYQMEFIPDQVSVPAFIAQVQSLQNQNKKVLISVGGATAPVSLDNITERDSFISSMNNIINTYGFDGMDIDLEGSSLTTTGGTIATPTDAKIIHLIYAIKQIMSDYAATTGKRLILTMAPETAFVQGGMSAFGGIWGAYLPVIHALRDSIEILHVQLYNSGSMYGIDGNIYTQGTADFIVAMTEAIIQGFNTSGGAFAGLPAHKVAVGLPACTMAAGGGYADTLIVQSALKYLLGTGPKPGNYTLLQTGGYPNLRGMMTWSINWDAVNTCASAYEYAVSFQSIFGNTVNIQNTFANNINVTVYPNPNAGIFKVNISSAQAAFQKYYYTISDITGRIVQQSALNDNIIQLHADSKGVYQLKISNGKNFYYSKLVVEDFE